MIKLNAYRDNPLAPTALVSKVGGIYRVDPHLIRVTFIRDIPNAEGHYESVAQAHLIWTTGRRSDWLDTRSDFDFAMAELRREMFNNLLS
jgi:hypothetical protein